MPNFRLSEKRAHPQIDGIDRDFLFGNARRPSSHPGYSAFPSRQGFTQVSGGLTLWYTNYHIAHLGLESLFGSSGASPVTLTPGGGGKNPLIVSPIRECLVSPFRHPLY